MFITHDPTQSLSSALYLLYGKIKIGEVFFCKIDQSQRLLRAVLTSNLHHGRQDLSNLEATKSADHQSEQSAKVQGNSSLQVRGNMTLITEVKENLTQQFRMQTLLAKQNRKMIDSTVRESPKS